MNWSIHWETRQTLAAASMTFVLALLALDASPAAHARTTITVTSLADDGSSGELRAAINQANSDADGDTIVFSNGLTGTITLNSALPAITASMTIQGPGSEKLAVDGGGLFQPFQVEQTTAPPTVDITSLTIQHGTDAATDSGGGAILITNATVTLSNCIINNNVAQNFGGGVAIDNDGQIVQFAGCTITGNSTSAVDTGEGGGIFASSGSTVSLTDCSMTANLSASGGGIYAQTPTDVNDCSISGNTANAGMGGAIYIDTSGTLALTDGAVTGNDAASGGGGIFNADDSGASFVTDCLISENSTTGDGGGIENNGALTAEECTISNNSAINGGGIASETSDLTSAISLTMTTLTGNSATGDGGGLINLGGATLNQCILTNNAAFNGGGAASEQLFGSIFTLSACTAAGNAAGGDGGGVYVTTNSTFTNCTLFGNMAASAGGGLSNEQGSVPTITNCTFAANSSTTAGGFNCLGGTTMNSDVLFTDRSTDGNEMTQSGLAATANNCDFGTPLPPSVTGVNPINQEPPQFDTNGLANNGGFAPTLAIESGSPLYGNGTSASAPAQDERGVDRPAGAPSIGAYDGGVLPAVPVPTILPAGAASITPESVTISDALSGASIYYTLDGTTPTQASTPVSGDPIMLSSSAVVKAIAAAPGEASSNGSEAALQSFATPVSNLDGDVASASFTVVTADTHTYPAGLSMISAPYDYAGSPLTTLFDYPNQVLLAIWSTTSDDYILSPEAPANTLTSGQGYWARFDAATSLLAGGTPSDPSKPFDIPLAAGWNIIGGPAYPVVLSATSLAEANGVIEPFSAAAANGLVDITLYGFQSGDSQYEPVSLPNGVLLPHQGYWIYATAQCTLVIPPLGSTTTGTYNATSGLSLVNGLVTLTMPAGALATGTQISLTTGVVIPTIVAVTSTDGASLLPASTGAIALGTGVQIEPSGTLSDSMTATLQMPVDPTLAPPGSVIAVASIAAGDAITPVTQSEFVDAILAAEIGHFSTWCAVAMNPWWGDYANSGGSVSGTVDLGGNIAIDLDGPSGPTTLLGSVNAASGDFTATDGQITLTGQFVASGTGSSETIAATGATLSGATTGTVTLTDQSTPLDAIIYASISHS